MITTEDYSAIMRATKELFQIADSHLKKNSGFTI